MPPNARQKTHTQYLRWGSEFQPKPLKTPYPYAGLYLYELRPCPLALRHPHAAIMVGVRVGLPAHPLVGVVLVQEVLAEVVPKSGIERTEVAFGSTRSLLAHHHRREPAQA